MSTLCARQQAKLVGSGAVGPGANQGWSVALSENGNTAIVGGPFDSGGIPGGIGAAWVFTRSDGIWSQQGPKLVATDSVGSVVFQGVGVSLSGDGNTAIVGGLGDNNAVGAAWVFTRSGGVWSQQAKLVGTGAIGLAEQGHSVALSSDGDTAIVGGPSDDHATGAVWLFTR